MRVLSLTRAFIIALSFALVPAMAPAQVSVGVVIDTAPPAIPVYQQPAGMHPNWMWTPGYWAWGTAGYYWVPGTWVAPPATGMLWTPGYWGYESTGYRWHGGYWGPTVGYYGGINYGFGYWGNGFYGGAWNGGAFRYNTAVWNVNRTYVHNTYVDRTVVNRYGHNVNRTSYNGGRGGVNAHETPEQKRQRENAKQHETAEQRQHEEANSHDRDQYANHNQGNPKNKATDHANQHPNNDAHEPGDDDKKAAASHSHPASKPPASHGSDEHKGGKPPA